MGSKEPHKPAAKSKAPPRCPRCGYNQSGEVASWVESCPLRLRCPECGVDFATVRLFRPAPIAIAGPLAGRRISGKLLIRTIIFGAFILLVIVTAIQSALAP